MPRTQKVANVDFHETEYGMWKQTKIEPFDYSKPYLAQQSTNIEMAYLRLGYLLSVMPFSKLANAKVLELGPGTGVMFEVLKKHVGEMHGYDVAESKYTTVSLKEAKSKKWDLLCGFDVVEHFHDIDELWDFNFRYGYFSTPRLPKQGLFEGWRHFKVNEHIYYFDEESFTKWADANGYHWLQVGCPEDLLRKRWDNTQPNILSYIIERKQ